MPKKAHPRFENLLPLTLPHTANYTQRRDSQPGTNTVNPSFLCIPAHVVADSVVI